MARSSSTGLLFLIRRPDISKFTYWRDVPPDVAPFVTREIELLGG